MKPLTLALFGLIALFVIVYLFTGCSDDKSSCLRYDMKKYISDYVDTVSVGSYWSPPGLADDGGFNNVVKLEENESIVKYRWISSYITLDKKSRKIVAIWRHPYSEHGR